VRNLDLSYTDAPICPHCFEKMTEAWELGDGGEGDGETDCGHCGEPFSWSRHVEVTYSTRKLEP
jgi:hypothetical protein